MTSDIALADLLLSIVTMITRYNTTDAAVFEILQKLGENQPGMREQLSALVDIIHENTELQDIVLTQMKDYLSVRS